MVAGVALSAVTSCVAVVGNTAQATVNTEATDYGKPSDVTANEGAFKIKTLKHNYDAFSKYVDAKTMYIHFSKHYVAYLNNLNKAVDGKPQVAMTIEELLKTLDTSNAALRNNAGGYYNHNLYFEVMTPDAAAKPTGKLADAINRDFGSFENFKKQFSEAGAKQFGSGWAWLVTDSSGKLKVGSTANQDNPLMPGMSISGNPILAMDVWEHAYYLKYQNKRADYIDAFFNVIDWKLVGDYYEKSIK